MGTLDGKVAFVTGGARAQGRSHAIAMAKEGADVVVVDICAPLEGLPYPLATKAELDETVELINEAGGRGLGVVADTRDREALDRAVQATVETFGRLDILVANAGIAPMAPYVRDTFWGDALDINLTGTFNTLQAATPTMVAGGNGGAIVIVSSVVGLQGMPTDHPGALGYIASKHGLVGLMRSYANFLAPHNIRVNTIHPTGVHTPMICEDLIAFVTSVGSATARNALPVERVEPEDISGAVLFLVSDAGRFVTGSTVPVDAGCVNN